jgi:hypothetical protein
MISSRASSDRPVLGSRDGTGCGDHDLPYTFGRPATVAVPFPFSTRQLARLLILRGRCWDRRIEERHGLCA